MSFKRVTNKGSERRNRSQRICSQAHSELLTLAIHFVNWIYYPTIKDKAPFVLRIRTKIQSVWTRRNTREFSFPFRTIFTPLPTSEGPNLCVGRFIFRNPKSWSYGGAAINIFGVLKSYTVIRNRKLIAKDLAMFDKIISHPRSRSQSGWATVWCRLFAIWIWIYLSIIILYTRISCFFKTIQHQ